MTLAFTLPLLNPYMSEARVECVYAVPGSFLKTGDKLFDLSIDLTSAFSQDCPPVSFFRIIVREPTVLREFRLAPGDLAPVAGTIAIFTTTTDEVVQHPPVRNIRFANAGILHHRAMWTGNGR